MTAGLPQRPFWALVWSYIHLEKWGSGRSTPHAPIVGAMGEEFAVTPGGTGEASPDTRPLLRPHESVLLELARWHGCAESVQDATGGRLGGVAYTVRPPPCAAHGAGLVRTCRRPPAQ